MLKRLAQGRQARGEPARRLLFNLLVGLTCDLEPLAAEAGQNKGVKIHAWISERLEIYP
jgi:hypothetical protein